MNHDGPRRSMNAYIYVHITTILISSTVRDSILLLDDDLISLLYDIDDAIKRHRVHSIRLP